MRDVSSRTPALLITVGPVGVRVHGTLRGEVLLPVCSAVGLHTAVDNMHTYACSRCSFSVTPQSARATQTSLAANQVDLR